MREGRIGRTETPLLPATAASKRLGDLAVGSAPSRAAARSLLVARKATEAERRGASLDGLAERIREARLRIISREDARTTPPASRDASSLTVRIEEARARVLRFAEKDRRGHFDEAG
jgi:hypothetical protein